MLTMFRRFMAWAAHPQTRPTTPAGKHAYCRESEFCFFNHSATLPFDQVNECQCDDLPREEKPGSR